MGLPQSGGRGRGGISKGDAAVTENSRIKDTEKDRGGRERG